MEASPRLRKYFCQIESTNRTLRFRILTDSGESGLQYSGDELSVAAEAAHLHDIASRALRTSDERLESLVSMI